MATIESRFKNTALSSDVFMFGASCAPYAKSMDWPMEEWDRDMATMRKMNFNTIRIFAAWDRIEQVEGTFDFTKPDYAVKLAGKHGLKVIVNFGGVFGNICGIYPPQFMTRKSECNPRWAQPRANAANLSTAGNVCPDVPLYRKKAFEFMERTVQRYADSTTVVGWMIWNEPTAPFCYCPHTLTRFRQWLSEKYQNDLKRLNATWGTEFPINYADWSEVQAPTSASVQTIWRDWLQFNQYRLSNAMEAVDRVVEMHDPQQRPTTSNIVFHMAAMEGPINAPQYGLDLGRVGQSMSILGVSSYITEHLYDPSEGYHTAYKLSRLRSASRDEHRRLLLLETGAGPNLRTLTEAKRERHLYHLIGHNVKSILLWNYRSRISDGQVALFHLMHWDGSISERAEHMAGFSASLQKNARLLNQVYPERQAAVLTLENQQILMDGLAGSFAPVAYKDVHDSRFGAYKLLWDLNIPADCLTECQLDELSQYPLLLLPMQEHMTAELAERISTYVANGGTVIAESPFAFRDGDGHLQYTAPAFGLDKVFGCQTHDRDGRQTASAIICPDGKAEVCFFWSRYGLTGGKALASYESGEAAVVVNNYGKGKAIVAGTEIFRQYLHNPQSAMTALLQREVLASGVKPTAKVTGDGASVEISRLSGPGGLMYLVINHTDKPKTLRLELRDGNQGWLDLRTDQPVDLSKEIVLDAEAVLPLKRS